MMGRGAVGGRPRDKIALIFGPPCRRYAITLLGWLAGWLASAMCCCCRLIGIISNGRLRVGGRQQATTERQPYSGAVRQI